MKFVIQRVIEGSVKVNGEIVGKINRGLVVLVGFTHSDKAQDIKFAANKLLNIRLWDDKNGVRWKECVKSMNYEILLVSQFTLYSLFKGNKPDFHKALDPEPAVHLYNTFVETLSKIYVPDRIQTGRFGEMMEVSLINDGPVTINWEYPEISEEAFKADEEDVNKVNENKNIPVNKGNKINRENSMARIKSNDNHNKNNTKNISELPIDLNHFRITLNEVDEEEKIEINIEKSDSVYNKTQKKENEDKK